MGIKIKTFVLKGFDNDQTRFLNNTIEYLSMIQNIENKVAVVDNLNLSLSQDDFLIVMIDELFVEQITQNINKRDFFIKKQFQNNQIILILDDINIQSLPEYLQYFQTFVVINNENNTEDDDELTEQIESKSNLFEVVNDVVHYLKRIKTEIQKESLTIYIGPADDNTTLEYQKITRELLHRDYIILPEVSNPSATELINNQQILIKMLESADLAIHFIGHKSLIDLPEKSSAAIKVNEITAKFCNTPEGQMLHRIVYIPSERNESNELLHQKILQFKSDTQSLLNAEIIQTPIEKFKEVVLQKLIDLAKPVTQEIKFDDVIDDIYLIYPPGEEKAVKPYTDWFDKNKIKYSRSQIELDQVDLLNYHQKKLVNCKGVAIYNSGNTEWLNRKLSDIKKSPGWGRNKAFKVKAIFGLTPEILNGNNDNSFIVINENDKLDSNKIKELLID